MTNTHPAALRAREILDSFGIDINDPINGVGLPASSHLGRHPNACSRAITARLNDLKRKEDVEETLGQISRGLSDYAEQGKSLDDWVADQGISGYPNDE